MVIWDDVKQKSVITLEFRTSVLRVRLSKSRIVVALLNSVHVFVFSTPPEKLSVFETTDNPLGLICLGKKLLAFPGRSPGQVQLVELETGNVSIIPAHSSSLRAIVLSPDGEVLATASEQVISTELIDRSDLNMTRVLWYGYFLRGIAQRSPNYDEALTMP